MRQSGPLLHDNRDVSEACVTRPLVRDWVDFSYYVPSKIGIIIGFPKRCIFQVCWNWSSLWCCKRSQKCEKLTDKLFTVFTSSLVLLYSERMYEAHLFTTRQSIIISDALLSKINFYKQIRSLLIFYISFYKKQNKKFCIECKFQNSFVGENIIKFPIFTFFNMFSFLNQTFHRKTTQAL